MNSASPLRILIVDDAATNRQILQVFLAKLGYPTLTATNGEEAVDIFSRERPDLILMDVMMPVMDGYEATRRIKAMCGKDWIPVIFLSALDKDENLVMGLDAGGDDYITKPINFVILDAKIRSVLRTLQMQRKLNAAQKQMAAISSTIVDGVVTIDQDGNIQWVNLSTQRIFGYSAEEITGQNISLLMPSPFRESHDDFLARFNTSGKTAPFNGDLREVSAKRKNGETFPLEIGVSVMDVDGSRYYVGIVRDITERKTIEQQLRSNAERLQRYYDQQEHENLLTQSLMERVSEHVGLNDPLIQRWISPASNFSGDSISASRSTENTLTAMLGDATGHGLAAAVSILPLVSTFYGMVEVNRKLAYIVERINHRLHVFLPTGRFVAATLVHIDESTRSAEIWQGGTPTVFWLHPDGSVKQRFEPNNLALGVVDSGEIEQQISQVTFEPGEQFVLYSDGVTEAENAAGEPFGEAKLLAALASADSAHRLNALRTALSKHLDGHDHQDDISILLLDCH